MTREEAEARAKELAAEDETHSYFARERSGEWEVVKVPAGPGRMRPSGTATEARPRPEADDPRPSGVRQVPPFGGAPF
jgi:hypothetical protein